MSNGIPKALKRICDDSSYYTKYRGAFKNILDESVKNGSDLSRFHWRILHWIITDVEINPGITHHTVRDAIEFCAVLLERMSRGENVSQQSAEDASREAYKASKDALKFSYLKSITNKYLEPFDEYWLSTWAVSAASAAGCTASSIKTSIVNPEWEFWVTSGAMTELTMSSISSYYDRSSWTENSKYSYVDTCEIISEKIIEFIKQAPIKQAPIKDASK